MLKGTFVIIYYTVEKTVYLFCLFRPKLYSFGGHLSYFDSGPLREVQASETSHSSFINHASDVNS